MATGQSQLVRKYAFTTYGQPREVRVVKREDVFRVFVDDTFVAIAECELEEMLLPVQIPLVGRAPLQGLLSHFILSVNEVTIEPWWTLEHGDVPNMRSIEVAEFERSSPSDIRIPSVPSHAKSVANGAPLRDRIESTQVQHASSSYEGLLVPHSISSSSDVRTGPMVSPKGTLPHTISSPDARTGPMGSPKGTFAVTRNESDTFASFGSLVGHSSQHRLSRNKEMMNEATRARSVQQEQQVIRILPDADDTRPFEDLQHIPEFVLPRQQKKSTSSWHCCSGVPESPRPKACKNHWASTTDEELGCPCCRPGMIEEEKQPIAKMWHKYCFDFGLELFNEA